MEKIGFQVGVEEKIDMLCKIFPDLIKNRWKERIMYNSQKIAAYEGSSEVTEDILWRSVYEVLPGGYEPLILQIKSPAKVKEYVQASRNMEDMEPGTEPLTIERWSEGAADSSPLISGKKILAVCSSARKGGNTDAVVDEVLRACADNGAVIEKFYLSDMDIKPCNGCRACRKIDVKTVCAIKDDMTSFFDKLYDTDGFVAGFPIYTSRENAIMANFMDRWDSFSNPHLSRGMPSIKKGIIICTWMWATPGSYDDVVEKMVMLMKLHGVQITDVLTVSGTLGKKHGKGVVKNHPELLKTAYRAGIDLLK